MKTRPLGRTGIAVSELCLGTMTWGSQNTEAEGHAQIDMARERGVNFMDTAEMYPTNPVKAETVGGTEEIIGSYFVAHGGRSDWVIATKMGGPGNANIRGGEQITGASLKACVENSLRRLKTDYIDIFQLHWPNRGSYHFRQMWGYDPSRQPSASEIRENMEEVLEALGDEVKAGRVRHFGLSNETAWGMSEWLRLAEAKGLPRAVSVQNEYSLLCRYYDTDLGELGHHEDVTLLAYSPLAAGLLTGKYAGDVTPDHSRRSRTPDLGGRITPYVWEAVSSYMGIADRHGLDAVQMAIAFILTRPFPVVPIIGATSLEQLDLVLGASELRLSEDVLAEISAAYRAHPVPY